MCVLLFFFSSRSRHTRCALVTGVQTCALPIYPGVDGMSLQGVPPHQVATIVTTLQMIARPKPAPLPSSHLRLVRWNKPAIAKYRALFRRVGEPWLWFSRLVMADRALIDIIHDEIGRAHV